LLVGAQEVDAVGAGADGVPGHDVPAAQLGRPSPRLSRDERAEPLDVLTHLVPLEPLGELATRALAPATAST
jgi:hypothetical protein